MAELASGLAGKMVELLASSAYEEIKQAWGVRNDLEKLRRTMASIQAVLLDAEEKQVHNNAITLWLEQLKSALYDVEDILADFQAEHLRRKVLGLSRWSFPKKVSRFFLCSSSNPILFRFKMAHRVREIRENLGEIAKIKKDFGLVERDQQPPQGGGGSSGSSSSREREMTHSYVHLPDIVGREAAKQTIIHYLDQRVGTRNVSVIPIVGMGGLGKTALAKLVYNDDWVKESFGIKLWVCVSDDLDLKKMIVKAIKSLGKELGNMDIEQLQRDLSDMDIDQLQRELRGILGGKRYLLVLDDVWEEDERKWQAFKALLMGGADGSKVIVTTRSDRVASIIGKIEAPYKIGELPHEDCLKLFFRCAFGEGEQRQWPIILRKIGEEIVTKCKGVPLAVMTLGSLLRFKTDETEWKSVRDSEIWKLEQKENDIMPALRLSYERLPSHLKSCFACCSIFPKDYEFFDFFLTAIWMSLDLLKPCYAGQSLEDVGRSYFKELASRGFFQDVEDKKFVKTCKMHDLMHDLALSVCGDKLFNIASNSSNKELLCPQKIRYLYSGNLDDQPASPDIIPFLQSLEHVRTAHFESSTNIPFVEACLPKFRYLRYLLLSDLNFDMLPKGVFSNSQHLRVLQITGNNKIRRLPSSICELHSLQFLNLMGCDSLEELPKNIKFLVSLQSLIITIKQVRLPNDGIGSLKALRSLFLEDCENVEHLCEDIQGLRNLQLLCISGCPRLKCLPQGVKYLPALESLVIEDCADIDLGLEDGEQNHNITSCRIRFLWLGTLPKLEQLPQWLLEGSANTLQVLSIEGCNNLKEFWNDLQNLRALQSESVPQCASPWRNRGRLA